MKDSVFPPVRLLGRICVPVCIAAVLLLSASCQKYITGSPDPGLTRKVLLLYADGYNNLTSMMSADITDLAKKAPMVQNRDRYTILVFSHFTQKAYDYRVPSSPVLMELYKDSSGEVIRDTVKVYPDSSISSSISMMNRVLTDVAAMYPAAEYGMIYSSHGTGWVPVEYYSYTGSDVPYFSGERRSGNVPLSDARQGVDPFLSGTGGRTDLLSAPLTKSLGCQGYYQGSTLRTYEMDVRNLSSAFPTHLKYLILDACLMGGVETAFELREVCDNVVFSAVEILSNGFDYENLPDRVLYPETPDFKAVCDDMIEMNVQGTVAWVSTSSLDALAVQCKELFDEYSTEIASLKADDVQCFGRYHDYKAHAWYFDLRDVLVKAGVTQEELSGLDSVLERCVLYGTCSEKFLTVELDTYCGLSMYLPSAGNASLDAYYKGYSWNKATSLVK